MAQQASSSNRDTGQILLIILVLLAIVASIVMLIFDSNAWLKVALLAALWAAVIGFFLVARYRQQAQAAEAAREADRQAFEAQVEAAQNSSAVTAPVPVVRDPELTAEMIAELKEEIASLRTQLEELSGTAFGYEPAALRAEARRILEVEARDMQPVNMPEPEPEPEPVVEPEPEAPAQTWAGPSADAIAGRIGNQETSFRQTPNPLAALINENQQAPEPEPEPQPVAEPEPEEPKEQEYRGGRRREESGGITVAELLARRNREARG